MKIITTIALLLSLPVMVQAGELFPNQPTPMSPGYGANGAGLHASKPVGIPNEACIINPVSMQTGVREVTKTELVDGDEIVIPTTMLFDFDGDFVRPKGREDLANVFRLLTEGGATELLVTGHTDSKGTEEYNMDLGLRRATAVAAVLTGLGFGNIDVASGGEVQPIAPNAIDGVDNPEGRQQNRRVVIEVLEISPDTIEIVEQVVIERNPQIFHVMSDSHSVTCAGTPRPFGYGLFISNGYYPSYQIYNNGQFLR